MRLSSPRRSSSAATVTVASAGLTAPVEIQDGVVDILVRRAVEVARTQLLGARRRWRPLRAACRRARGLPAAMRPGWLAAEIPGRRLPVGVPRGRQQRPLWGRASPVPARTPIRFHTLDSTRLRQNSREAAAPHCAGLTLDVAERDANRGLLMNLWMGCGQLCPVMLRGWGKRGSPPTFSGHLRC